MYCPGCGTETTQGLNYCKQCGASLVSQALVYQQGKPPGWLVLSFLIVIGMIAIIGLVGPIASADDLRRNGFSPKEAIVLCSAAMGGAALMIAFLSKLLFRLLSMYTGGAAEPAARAMNRSGGVSPRRIGAPPLGVPAVPEVGVPSVTEQTTRSFDLPRYSGEEEGEPH
jgi:hypothetical protein